MPKNKKMQKFNIHVNQFCPFRVKVRVITKRGRTADKEYKIEAKDFKIAGFEAVKIAKKQNNIKSAKWLYCIDILDRKVCY
jgi:hypothetical protein